MGLFGPGKFKQIMTFAQKGSGSNVTIGGKQLQPIKPAMPKVITKVSGGYRIGGPISTGTLVSSSPSAGGSTCK